MKRFFRLQTEAHLIEPQHLDRLIAVWENPQAAEHPLITEMRKYVAPKISMTNDGIAIVPVEGVLARKPDLMEFLWGGYEDSENILKMIADAAGNPKAKAVLLNVDSPGGFITGGPEIADAVRAAAKSKPVYAWTGGTMASLAYWIGSQADKVIASRSALVGSIGAYTTHIDSSKLHEQHGIKVEVIKNKEATHKAAGIYGTSLTDEHREHMQGRMQAAFNDFRSTVKATRPQASDAAMKGQTFYGSEAKAVGLIDGVGSMSYALSALRSKIRHA